MSDSIDFEVECNECGNILVSKVEIVRGKILMIFVEPCEKCLKEKYKKGMDDAE